MGSPNCATNRTSAVNHSSVQNVDHVSLICSSSSSAPCFVSFAKNKARIPFIYFVAVEKSRLTQIYRPIRIARRRLLFSVLLLLYVCFVRFYWWMNGFGCRRRLREFLDKFVGSDLCVVDAFHAMSIEHMVLHHGTIKISKCAWNVFFAAEYSWESGCDFHQFFWSRRRREINGFYYFLCFPFAHRSILGVLEAFLFTFTPSASSLLPVRNAEQRRYSGRRRWWSSCINCCHNRHLFINLLFWGK